ncbi:MAG: cytochrome c [bacterium]|nr:cytochrome c [bacterium]
MSVARRPVAPAVLLSALLALLAAPGARASSEPDVSLDRGKKVHRNHCLECHGKDGRGDGERARRLGFKPRDFTLGSFKCRCTPSGSLPTDEDLLRVVTRGLPGTPMKGYEEAISEVDRRSVVEYVKSLSPAFADQPTPQCLEVPTPEPSSDQSVAEGRQVYRLLRC